MKLPLIFLTVNAVLATTSLQAAVVGYWRFEDGAFMDDSSGNNRHLTTNTAPNDAEQIALPASGNGSEYPTTIPATSATNGSAAAFDGDDRMAVTYNAAFKSTTMTLEAFVTTTVTSGTQTVAGMWNATSNRVYLMALSTNVLTYFINGGNVSSGLPALAANTDYYVGISVDLSDATTNALTFYQKNLATGQVWISNVASPTTTLTSGTSSFSIGRTSANSSSFTGLIDEVRFSNTKLGAEDLLVVIPEPSVVMLGAAAGLLGFRRKRGV